MRRVAVAVAVAGLVVAAALASDPGVAEPEPFVAPPATAPQSLWSCPGAELNADPAVTAALLTPGRVRFGLPAEGEIGDGREAVLAEAGAERFDVGELALFYPGAVIVEVSGGPAAVFETMAVPGILAGDVCPSLFSQEWHLTGGSTGLRRRLDIRLFNPLLEPARVNVEITTEFGSDPAPDLRALSVPPRDWIDVDLGVVLGGREQISATVVAEGGVVVPSFVMREDAGAAVWSGTGLSPDWEFPLVGVRGERPVLTVRNPQPVETTAIVELISPEGALGEPRRLLVPAEGVASLSFDDVTVRPFGLRLSAEGSVAAAVVSRGPAGLSGTIGAVIGADRWLVPAGRGLGASDVSVWVLNTGAEEATVGASLPSGEVVAGPVTVAAGGLARIQVPPAGAVVVDSSAPVTVSWTITAGGDLAAGAGAALGT